MAVALSIQHWRPYLMGRKFTVFTDQKSLRQLLQQRITTMDQQNWAAKLLGYQFDIVYKPGLENKGADALSHMHDSPELHSLVHYPEWLEDKEVLEEVHKDEVLKGIISALQKGEPTKPGFAYRRGVLFYENRLVLAAFSKWIPKAKTVAGISFISTRLSFGILSYISTGCG